MGINITNLGGYIVYPFLRGSTNPAAAIECNMCLRDVGIVYSHLRALSWPKAILKSALPLIWLILSWVSIDM
jgi:hypothetical protein